ncbi:extracellular solute-binding protein [Corticibacter populi]|uniref:Extracellular solute-binding protein n=1 Tax=Corticibacter populi TaxID=1550736 RepID=A0A3M6QK76_9BURK|nr:ABC transporter substrate-binding protein [Corticibacter populi]RMX03504.1 extracellular solute-binding protein [Corticibacter populi]RZS29949.1 putative spermidine/putrescine transport system substrate-binding protein [Corticibacter populi]
MKTFTLALATASCISVLPALATAEDIYVGSYGGSTENVFKQRIIPAFEKATGHKIIYVAGNSTDTLAKLQAERNNPQFDVVLIDDGPMEQAVQYGFCGSIEPAPIYDDLYPLARIANDQALALGVVATGLFYNTEAFAKAGWAAPDSWEALTDAKYADRMVIPPISNGYGLQTLLMFADLRGGGASNIDPGFKALIDEVGPNVLAWEPSPGKMTELFQNGDAVIGVWGSGRVKALQDTGFPVKFVYPKEGAYALFTAICPVAKKQPKAGSQQFIQFLFSPESQTALAEGQAWGPVNSKVTLAPEVADKVPYGPEQIGQLKSVDYGIVNAKRAEWTNRWNRTVER